MNAESVKPNSILIKNGMLLTMNPEREILSADILIEDDRISQIGRIETQATTIIDATDKLVMPGFVQTHTHLCQTLFRNQADDLSLLDWLQQKIWPMEAAHTEQSITLSANLGIAELFRCGTTTIMDMGTVHHTDAIFTAAEKTGIRAIIGKALMDAGNGIPVSLSESTRDALDEVNRLIKDWHGVANGRLQFALTPRFLISCSNELMLELKILSFENNLIVHSHASESVYETKIINEITGTGNIEAFCDLGLTGPRLCLAHCIWISDDEMELLARTGTKVMHCPSANMKLASGIAHVPEMLEKGIAVSLGADGAPCNNNMDIFMEMRLAAFIQKVRLQDPKALPAQKVVEMATIDGAKVVGLEKEIGSLEVGKKADIILLNLNTIHTQPVTNPYAQLVYSARPENVQTVIVDGKVVMKDRELLTVDEGEVLRKVTKMS